MGLYIHASHGASCVRVCSHAAPGAALMRLQGLASRLQTVVLRHSASPCAPAPPTCLSLPGCVCVAGAALWWGPRCMSCKPVGAQLHAGEHSRRRACMACLVRSSHGRAPSAASRGCMLQPPAAQLERTCNTSPLPARMGKARAPASEPPMTHLTKA